MPLFVETFKILQQLHANPSNFMATPAKTSAAVTRKHPEVNSSECLKEQNLVGDFWTLSLLVFLQVSPLEIVKTNMFNCFIRNDEIISSTKGNPFFKYKNYAYQKSTCTLQLLGNKVVFFQHKGEIETGTRNIEPLVD